MLTSTAAVLALVAGILTSLGIIYRFAVRPLIKGVAKVHAVFEMVMDLDERITSIEERTRQLTNNGGSHMKDAIERIEKKIDTEVLSIYKHLAGVK
jgi:hypothetical protein